MKRLGLWIATYILLGVGLGCGHGGAKVASPSAQPFGRATFTLTWPKETRLIPAASKSIIVVVKKDGTGIKAKILTRPSGGGTSTVTFDPLPVGDLTATATAYPNAETTGTAQATATVPLKILPSQDTPFVLTMASTITSIAFASNAYNLTAGNTTLLSPIAKDASGSVVLIAPSKGVWSSTNKAVATVDATGIATGVTTGKTTITYTDTESGKSASTQITVKDVVAPSFLTPVSYDVPNATDFVAAGDFDNDGNPDVVIAPFTEVGVLYGHGDGTLDPYTPVQTGFTGARLRAVADVDNDGWQDIVMMDMGTNELLVVFNQGGRTFAPAVKTPIDAVPSDVYVGDLDGDGLPDMVVTFWGNGGSGSFSVFRNNGNRTFTKVTSVSHIGIVEGVGGGDINGDGHPDLIITYQTGTINQAGGQIYYGKGDGTFTPGETYNIGSENMTSPFFVDLNGDGKLDMIFNDYWNYTIAVFINKGNGTFKPFTGYSSPIYPLITRVGDINSDGIPDIVAANAGSDHISVLTGKGGGIFGAAQTFPAGGVNCRSCWIVDLNKDGKPDIVTQNENTKTIGVLINNTP